jgi:hypothetical protein
MKDKLVLALILTLFTASIIPVQGMELELSGALGNIFFDSERTESLGEGGEPFEPAIQPMIRSIVSGEIGDTIFYTGGFEWDPVLRNRLFANVGVRLGFLNVEVGPFIGILNTTDEILNPGVSVAFGLEFPGIFFANIRTMSSMAGVQGTAGSYSQKGTNLTAGFWIPNIIFSLNLDTRSFTLQKEPNMLLEDGLIRYFIRADIYAKNNPFSFRLDIGYGSLTRSYISQIIKENEDGDGDGEKYYLDRAAQTDELKYIYMGLKAAYVINPLVKIFLAGEMPVYTWSEPPMRNPAKNSILFQAQFGVVLSFQ